MSSMKLFEPPRLSEAARAKLERIDALRARLRTHLREPVRWTGVVRRSALGLAIQASNAIEGYRVSVEDAIAAVETEEPSEADATTWAEVTGYRLAMTYVLQLVKEPGPCSLDLLKSLHFMMLSHDLSKGPGQWRPGLVSVRRGAEEIYVAPDAALVPELMARLVERLNERSGEHPVVTAAMAHLNLAMIHPFRDGNGRMARCLQTWVLGRDGVVSPEFSSIEEFLGAHTADYYAVLDRVGRGSWHPEHDALPWLDFCLEAHLAQASIVLDRVERTRRLWDALERLLHERGLPARMIFALADAANGLRVRNNLYRKAAEVTANLASRDLMQLVDEGLLVARGERRGRFYAAAPALLGVGAAVDEVRDRARR